MPTRGNRMPQSPKDSNSFEHWVKEEEANVSAQWVGSLLWRGKKDPGTL